MDGSLTPQPPRDRFVFAAALLLAAAIGSGGCSRHDHHRAQFEKLDVDHNASLSLEEFSADASPDAGPRFEQADASHDERLSFDEFETTVRGEHRLLWFLGIFSVVSFIGSLVAIPVVVARLPEDHFVAQHQAADWVTSSPRRRCWLVVKNLLGVLLIAGGLLMLVLPGQGLLTILLGVALLDLPGKWKLMRALARRPNIMKALNWMRHRAQRPPMLAPPPGSPAG